MARILFGSIPLIGHIGPTLPIARQLLQMGHEVAYISHPEMKDSIASEGITLLQDFKWGDVILQSSRIIAAGNKRQLKQLIKQEFNTIPFMGSVYQLEVGVAAIISLMAEWQPDICVFDALFFPGIIAADASKISYVISCPTPMVLPGKDGLPHAHNLLEKVVLKIAPLFFRKVARPLNRVRAAYGLPPAKGFLFTQAAHAYLNYTTGIFEARRTPLLPEIYNIGPSVSTTASTAADFPLDWLEGGPLVYLTMGTIHINKKVIDNVILASKGAPWKIVITVGKHLDIASWENVPSNVLLCNYAPQAILMERIDALISVGGFGTISQALQHGVPIVVIPQITEHFDTARRILAVKAGIRIFTRQATPQNLRKAISALLNNPDYRHHAEIVAADFARCDAPVTAANLILKLATVKRPLPRREQASNTLYQQDLQEVLSSI